MSRKKIVHITQALGGVKTFLMHLIAHADTEIFEFTVIAPADESFYAYCAEHNVSYYPIPLKRGVSLWGDCYCLWKIVRLLRKIRPVAVHAHSAKGGYIGRIAAKLSSVNVIYTPHAFSYLSFTGIKRVFFYLLEYFARNWMDILWAVSDSEANRAIFEVGVEKHKVIAIPNSIPINKPLPAFKNDMEITIGMISRLTHQKNPLLFLEIASLLHQQNSQLRFKILGAGLHDHLAHEINAFIRAQGLERCLSILPWGDHHSSERFMASLDIFVMTSAFEGLPFSLLEAMAYGIPCVVSKVDGNTDVIDNNENGFSCTNAGDFVEKLKKLIENAALRKEIGIAGYHDVVRRYNIDVNIRSMEAVYHSLT